MADKHLKDLERAKELFYGWKLNDAYLILRRFFDRLPFSPQKEHALYLSYFVRCLLELGKDRELNFYRNQIETLARKWRTPDLLYQLAEVYCLGPQKNISAAKTLLEKVISDPNAKALHAKAKIFLAYCFDIESNDTASCREIIYSISDPEDRSLSLILQIWKIKISRDEGQLLDAETQITELIQIMEPTTDWYAYFSAQIIRTGILMKTGKKDHAQQILMEIRRFAEQSPFKTIKTQLASLEASCEIKPPQPEFFCEQGIHSWRITYGRKNVEIKQHTISAKIFELFSKKEWVDKGQVAKRIQNKEYIPELDDNKVHFQIHTLRKILMELDTDLDPITFEDGGYRMLPKLVFREGEI